VILKFETLPYLQHVLSRYGRQLSQQSDQYTLSPKSRTAAINYYNMRIVHIGTTKKEKKGEKT